MSKQRFAIVSTLVVMLAVFCMLWLTGKPPARPSSTLPAAMTNITQFTPYMFQLFDGYRLDTASVSYSQGVLVFQIVNNGGQSIAVTEQPLPSSVQAGIDPHATQVDGADGSALITYHGTATSAALFSAIHHGAQTMVLLNTTAPVSQSTIADLLRGLRAIR